MQNYLKNLSFLFFLFFICIFLLVVPKWTAFAQEDIQEYTEIIDVREYMNTSILIRVDGGTIKDIYYQKSDGTYADIDGQSKHSEKGIMYGNYWYNKHLYSNSGGLSSDPTYQNIKLVIQADSEDYQVSVMDGTNKPFDFSSINLTNGNYIYLENFNGPNSSRDRNLKLQLQSGKEYFYFIPGTVNMDIVDPNGKIIKHHDRIVSSRTSISSYFVAEKSGEYTLKFSNGLPQTIEVYPVVTSLSDLAQIHFPTKEENINFSSKAFLIKPTLNKALLFDATASFINNNTETLEKLVSTSVHDYVHVEDSSRPSDVDFFSKIPADSLSVYMNKKVWFLGELNHESTIAKAITFQKYMRFNKDNNGSFILTGYPVK